MIKCKVIMCVNLFILLLSSINSIAYDLHEIDSLIYKHGKSKIVDLIIEKRAGVITISINGQLREETGTPDNEYINTITIDRDLTILNISPNALSRLINNKQTESTNAAKRNNDSTNQLESAAVDPSELKTEKGIRRYHDKMAKTLVNNVEKACSHLLIKNDIKKYNICAEKHLQLNRDLFTKILSAAVIAGYIDLVTAENIIELDWPNVLVQ